MTDIDPNRSTSASLNRRAFVGIGTGAAVWNSSIAAALAAGETLGKPHPPLVPEDDPSLQIEHPTLESDGSSIDAYYAAPKDVHAQTASIVLVQAVWGIDTQLRDVARRFAKEGFITIAPDLYARQHVKPADDGLNAIDVYRQYAAKLDDAQVTADLDAAAAYLKSHASAAANIPARIGLTGFCMGAGIVLHNAATKTFDAAAAWYGPIRKGKPDGPIAEADLALADRISIPLLGSYGARDTSIPPADVRAFFARLHGPHDVKIYDEAGHAFEDDTRDRYVASAASDSWTRTVGWFRKYLAPT